ncbi:chymotrypsin family serine protease [Mycobacteroides abscessus]|uniref:hypothetical protein n=1 Tax=Mycobacteroides abscessus TaxID=36809 RepID=UPI00092AE5CB|nr:hypothetical protein [Mycobacteroides abscessus]SIF24634.1 trypsin domain-containing protein [Mycobacteroides abscessus subsp. abscessus]SIF38262.1 trypsin domain-containing protein [Mycobacteroides abscessus subsp. abscessus]SIF84391.1 trypsin domain-containing protein [Mycobacteroides abscessus subsp. abscessus]
MNVRHALVVAVVVAAAATSACSNGAASETRSWPTPSPVSAETPEWVSVPWMKVNANKGGDQFGGVPTPGIVIAQENGDGAPYRCTLGAAIHTADDTPAFLTAGHCDENPGHELWLYPSAEISGLDVVRLPQPYANVADSDDKRDPKTGVVSDHAVVPLTKLSSYATVIAGNYRVAGVLTTTAAKALAAKTPICFDGAVSGLRCGVVSQGSDNGALRFASAPGAPTDNTPFISKGDSGGPVFVVDGQKRVALVGLLSSGTEAGDTGWVSYLDSELAAVGAKAVLDPSVTRFDGSDYSASTTS